MNTQKNALQNIYSLVVGIILAILVGVGINTFYPYPDTYNDPRMQEINERYSACYENDYSGSNYNLKKEEACRKNIDKERDALQKELSAKAESWGTNVSIILIIISTLTVVLSLILNERIEIISKGLMLGSFFTLLGGVGTSFFTQQKVVRFIIICISFAITLGIGYFVFIKKKKGQEVEPVSNTQSGPTQNGPTPGGTI
jgi:hypothetical protein